MNWILKLWDKGNRQKPICSIFIDGAKVNEYYSEYDFKFTISMNNGETYVSWNYGPHSTLSTKIKSLKVIYKRKKIVQI